MRVRDSVGKGMSVWIEVVDRAGLYVKRLRCYEGL